MVHCILKVVGYIHFWLQCGCYILPYLPLLSTFWFRQVQFRSIPERTVKSLESSAFQWLRGAVW